MTPEAMAALHRRCFDAAPRPWTAAEFSALAAEPTTICTARAEAFALGRCAAGEAELLTLAVAPEARRAGLATALVREFEAEAMRRGGETAFLEVAADNAPARALYRRLGYAVAGRRPGYYRRAGAAAVDALVLRRSLVAAGPGKTD